MTLDPAVAAALRAARSIGMFFAVDFDASAPGWESIGGLEKDAMSLRRRVAVTREAIAATAACTPEQIPVQVAASIDLLAVAARIVSPMLAASALAGVAPQLRADEVWLRPGGVPVAITSASATPVGNSSDAAAALHAGVIRPVIAPLVALYRSEFAVSPQVLWGDIASALNGAAQVLDGSGVRQRIAAGSVATTLLSTPELAGTALTLAPQFRRNSCCLYYRIPGGGICGDCVLAS